MPPAARLRCRIHPPRSRGPRSIRFPAPRLLLCGNPAPLSQPAIGHARRAYCYTQNQRPRRIIIPALPHARRNDLAQPCRSAGRRAVIYRHICVVGSLAASGYGPTRAPDRSFMQQHLRGERPDLPRTGSQDAGWTTWDLDRSRSRERASRLPPFTHAASTAASGAGKRPQHLPRQRPTILPPAGDGCAGQSTP